MSDPQYAPAAYQPARQLNVLALIALIASCIGFTVPGVVMGHIALHQLKTRDESGRPLAIAALIVGYVLFALSILITIGLIVWLVAGVNDVVNSTDWENFG